MITYMLIVEMPTEVEQMIPFEEMAEDSLMQRCDELQNRYTIGFSFDVENRIMLLLFPSQGERDYAYNELRNWGFDAIRMWHTVETDEFQWTNEGQEQIRKENEEWLNKAEKKMRKRGKRIGR